jgi:hypothetical protein
MELSYGKFLEEKRIGVEKRKGYKHELIALQLLNVILHDLDGIGVFIDAVQIGLGER